VDEIRLQGLAQNQALLHYVLAEDRSYLWLVTRQDLRLFALPAQADLREEFFQLSTGLSGEQAGNVSFRAPARRLHGALLGPAADHLAPYEELILVADGFLGFLPFEVLLTRGDGDSRSVDLAELPYLLKEKTIRYAPSASFLVFHAGLDSEPRSWKKDALLFGDPVFAKEMQSAGRSGTRAGVSPESFQRLRGTQEEVAEIAGDLVEDEEFATVFRALQDLEQGKVRSAVISGSRFDLYVGAEVHEQRFRSDLRGYRILHVATHGYYDHEYPWFSGLVLSSAKDDPEGAGFLNLLELGSLRLDAEIVFLSACETGKGELLASEGVQSVARSFLISGAQSVIATQWAVRDDVASSVARTFYRELDTGLDPAEALRAAKLSILQGRAAKLSILEGRDRGVRIPVIESSREQVTNLHAHPSLWASFVIYGGTNRSLLQR
jgi:CHAT domain-containing protein